MPNVTMYIASEAMPSEVALGELTERCTDLCTGTLRAAPENVHVMYVPVLRGRGHAVFAEVLFREEPFRPPTTMAAFVRELDHAIEESTGLTARIRCFGFGERQIHARN
jgi:hypothetical protein